VAEPPRSQEELVQQSKQAVVHLKGNSKGGSGFFVTETGVIVTNAHVVRGEDIVFAELADGQRLEAKIVYEDPEVDIALAKVKGKHFPHLTLAEVADVRQGENVIAIGSPGGAMSFSVTKGIVSAVGPFPTAGPGTWIETDTAINPGSSGGPLLNSRGEAIGMSTQKLVKEDVSGIGFALSSSNLLAVLRRFYPKIDSGLKTMASEENVDAPMRKSSDAGSGTVIFSQPEGAEIWVDRAFVGKVPATLPLSVGQHVIAIKVKNRADWITSITIVKGSQVSLSPEP
jgi:S1-C subfamily serine protease